MRVVVSKASIAAATAVAAALAHYYLARRRRLAFNRRYGLCARFGFMPASCAEALPAGFEAWDALAVALPSLNRTGTLRAAVDALPLLRPDALLTEAEARRAYVLLSCAAHSYINGCEVPWERVAGGTAPPSGAAPTTRLPRQLAVPWRIVCARLGVPTVLIATGTDLWNHGRRVGRERWWAARSASNFRLLISMTGTRSEVGFHAIPYEVQLLLAPLLPALLAAPDHVGHRSHWRLWWLCRR